MSGIEERIAVEVAKPAVGFIDALLGSKIDKLKRWVIEKDLNDKVDNDNLSRIMEVYFRKLSCRVSEITSISFSVDKLDIFEAYEPLHLQKININKNEESENVSVADLIETSGVSFIILDGAGMGKSTFSKYVVTEILFKSERIPILFELRKIDKNIDLTENLAKELDFPGRVFDRGLFYKLLELGKLFIIVDGFDEVELEYQQELANQIHELSVKGGDNTLILTTRPQDVRPNIVNCESLHFDKFTIEQAKSLLRRYDKISGLDVGENLIGEIDSVPEKFIESPLLVSLLYRTFGVNKSIADRVSTFYDEIYGALYKGHDLVNKNGYGREKKSKLDFEDFRRLLRALCYYMMLSRKASFNNWSEAVSFVDKASEISGVSPTTSLNYLDDLLVAVPLLQKEGSELKFFHRTILEYFAAEYLVYFSNSADLLERMLKSKFSFSFSKVFDFIADMNISLFDSVITHHFAFKASQIKKCDDVRAKVLVSYLFGKEVNIGFWSYKDYSRENSEGKLTIDFGKADISFIKACTRTEELNGQKYFLVVTYDGAGKYMNKTAWSSITEEIFLEDAVEDYGDVSGLANAIGLNRWAVIDRDLIESFKDNDIFFSLVLFLFEIFEFTQETSLEVISDEKVQHILERVSKESRLDKELNMLLE